LKEIYKDLRCPHCGAKEFRIVNDDVFLCEYCNQKFNFNVDDVPLTGKNSVFVEEMKEQFNRKIAALNEKKRQSNALLLYYRKLANPTKLVTVSAVIFAVSSLLLVSALIYREIISIIFPAISFAVSLTLFVFAKIHKKIRSQKYRPYVTYLAAEIADYDNEINYYTKLISKLTR